MTSYKVKKTDAEMKWFLEDRFGMFIHFGLYSMTGRHEWSRSREKITDEKYNKYFKYFQPDLFDPKEWAAKAKAAGMKYAVMTAKHHEGFCMFDSEYTDYKSTNTPAGRDFIKEYVEAFRDAGLKVGIYYSLLDWHHPDYQIDVFHPHRSDKDAREQNKKRSMNRYREYLFHQVRELLTKYGKIDIIWFDFTYPDMESVRNEYNEWFLKDYQEWMEWTNKETWDSPNLIKMIREINPDIIINNRTGIPQDITTPEQTMMAEWPRFPGTNELYAWEACHTFSGAWGYSRDEMSWKSPENLIRILIDCVSCGGNLIMNVGPTSRGTFDKRADEALEVYGEWMKYNGRSIYGCTKAEPEFTAPEGTKLTQSVDNKRLYMHFVDYPYSEVAMANLADKIDYAQLLHDGSEIKYRLNTDGSVNFIVPAIQPKQSVTVMQIFLK